MAEPIVYSMSDEERQARGRAAQIGETRFRRDDAARAAGPNQEQLYNMSGEYFQGGGRFFEGLQNVVSGTSDLDVLESAAKGVKAFEKRRDFLKDSIDFAGKLSDRRFTSAKDVADLYKDYTDRQIDLRAKSFDASQKAVNLEETYKKAFRDDNKWDWEVQDRPFEFAKLQYQTKSAETNMKTSQVNLGRASFGAQQDRVRAQRDTIKFADWVGDQAYEKVQRDREALKWEATKRDMLSNNVDFLAGKKKESPEERVSKNGGESGATPQESAVLKNISAGNESIKRSQVERNILEDYDKKINQGQTDLGSEKWVMEMRMRNPEMDDQQIAELESEKTLIDRVSETMQTMSKPDLTSGGLRGLFEKEKTTIKRNTADKLFEEGKIDEEQRDYIISSDTFERNLTMARPDIGEVLEKGEDIEDGRFKFDITQYNKSLNDELSKDTEESFEVNSYSIASEEKLDKSNRQKVLSITSDKLKRSGADIENVNAFMSQYLETGELSTNDPKIINFINENLSSTELEQKKQQATMKIPVYQNSIKAHMPQLNARLLRVADAPEETQIAMAEDYLKTVVNMTESEAKAYAPATLKTATNYRPHLTNLVDMKYSSLSEVDRLKGLAASGEISPEEFELKLSSTSGLQTVEDHLIDTMVGAVEGNYNPGFGKVFSFVGLAEDPRKIKAIAGKAKTNNNVRNILRGELRNNLQPDLADMLNRPILDLEDEELGRLTKDRMSIVNFEGDAFRGMFTDVEDILESAYEIYEE